MKIDVYNEAGQVTGAVDLDDGLFGKVIRRRLLADVIRMYEANRRAGTRSTLARGEVRGGGRKPWRQKGTGRARQGSIRAVHWVGGAVALAPKPQDWSFAMPRKALKEAFRCALLAKARDHEVRVLEDVAFEKPSTKRAGKMLKALGVEGRKSLFVTAGVNKPLLLSLRNIPKTEILPVAQLNAYNLLSGGQLVFLRSSVQPLIDRMKA
jgi:large subunit ribosomal protein L4